MSKRALPRPMIPERITRITRETICTMSNGRMVARTDVEACRADAWFKETEARCRHVTMNATTRGAMAVRCPDCIAPSPAHIAYPVVLP